ncbi:syntenin-2 isoform X1 [Nothoprocta perdicaria]|uniref:syntenin-2 isoform X1 n=1 Tax=Nothoprocta perdicaria TaxID=30464 RepID=UPI000E1B868F|nr:syntenin-2 isoform X1 [Nothoprocta perdicaria]
MATLYPSLEDMKGHQLLEAQARAGLRTPPTAPAMEQPSGPPGSDKPGKPCGHGGSARLSPCSSGLCPAAVPALYPDLAALDDYMGLALSSADVQRSLVPAVGIGPRGGVPWPRRLVTPWPAPPQAPGAAVPGQLVAPLSGGDAGLRRAAIKPGLREIHLCKDERGKTGLKLKNIDQGIFVQLVKANSPAALVGLRFGDQVLQLDGRSCAGWSSDKAQRALRKASPEKIVMVVRDRPFQRTVTVHKDSNGHVGFVAKKGQIVSLTKDGSAARNGLLTHHYICEVNGQNVIGLKDKQLQEVLAGAGRIVTLTIIPAVIYEHMVKRLSPAQAKTAMDRSVPDL